MNLQKEIKLMIELPSLQFFALGDNNDLPVRRYNTQFVDLLPTVFNKRAYFGDFSAGGLEVLDGIQFNDEAFKLKTSDIPSVLATYSTDANTAFGTGTSNSTRFGPLKEIIYSNVAVPYEATWAIHEGFDRFTVNTDLDAAVADRLTLATERQMQLFDRVAATRLNTAAGVAGQVALADYTDQAVNELFNTLTKNYIDLEVDVTSVVAKVNADLYNAIVNGSLATTNKSSAVNIDDNNIVRFKGIEIQAVPAGLLPSGVGALVYPKSIGKMFVGINTLRTIEAIDFDGQQLQGAGKYGSYVLPDNAKAVFAVTVTGP